MAGDDLESLGKRIGQAKEAGSPKGADSKENADRSAGMRAGSEFMAYIISGGLVGWAIGHFFGAMPLWLILMTFAGFGLGIYRAARLMK